MNIKKYQAKDMRRALKKITDDLGSEAVILSNRKIEGGVELWASLSSEALLSSNEAQVKQKTATTISNKSLNPLTREAQIKQNAKVIADREIEKLINSNQASSNIKNYELVSNNTERSGKSSVENKSTDALQFNHAINELKSEINQQKKLIDSLVKLKNQEDSGITKKTNNNKRSLILDKMGFKSHILEKYFNNNLKNNQLNDEKYHWNLVLSIFNKNMLLPDVKTWLPSESAEQQKKFIFMGPTGSGKTSTISKIAADYLSQGGAEDDIGLIGTEQSDIGSYFSLKSHAKQLNINFLPIDMNQTLDQVLYKFKSKKMVLIDTTGGDVNALTEKYHLQSNKLGLAKVLVLPATAQYDYLKALINSHKMIGVDHSVITKLDEAVTLGEVLSVILDNTLRLSLITDGVSLYNDIHQPNLTEILSYAKYLATNKNSLERFSENSELSVNY